MTKAAGVRVNNSQYGEPTVRLADDPGSQCLTTAIELHMGNARIRPGPGRQSRQNDRFIDFSQSQEKPARLLVASWPRAVFRIFLEQRPAYPVGNRHPR